MGNLHIERWNSLYWTNPPTNNNYKLWLKYKNNYLKALESNQNAETREKPTLERAELYKGDLPLYSCLLRADSSLSCSEQLKLKKEVTIVLKHQRMKFGASRATRKWGRKSQKIGNPKIYVYKLHHNSYLSPESHNTGETKKSNSQIAERMSLLPKCRGDRVWSLSLAM